MATDKQGWNDDGTPDEDPPISLCLHRAAWSLQVAYKLTTKKDGERISEGRRDRLMRFGHAYATLAIALQNERDYEERQVQRIVETSRDG